MQVNGAVTNTGSITTGQVAAAIYLTITSGLEQQRQPNDQRFWRPGERGGYTLNNTGAISVATGATLNLTGQPGGVTDVVAGSSFSIAGSFTAGANNAFMEFNQH